MLSENEQRALEEIERSFDAEAHEPVLSPPGDLQRGRRTVEHPVARALIAVGGGIGSLLLIVGVPVAALAMGTATWLVWLLWRYWDLLSDRGESAPPASEAHRRSGRAARRRRRQQLVEHLRRMAEAE